ncbi:hypothetical protein DBR42_18760 [Pelomonas sp. HMWF004]|nr:hypothetical protein DBR42_18760 [Pelomonas sp. HMWF004]
MNALLRSIALAVSAAMIGLNLPALALTDANADIKEAVTDRSARVVVVGRSAPVMQTVWVPPTAKSLDSFKPVFRQASAPIMVQAEARR